MKSPFAVVTLLLLPFPALAQPAPAFVPFTIQQSDYQDMLTFLRHNVPDDYADPIRQWLVGKENQAAAAAAKEKAEKPVVPAAPAEKPKAEKTPVPPVRRHPVRPRP